MYQDRIEYLKRVIKRTYKRYTGERTDGKATLADVAKFFNIPIDESRVEDYIVKNIDYKTPSIEIVDKRNNISYTANYTEDAELLNRFGDTKRFNNVVSISPIRKVESLYYIESETPIVTKLTFKEGDYELVFEKEMTNSVNFFANDGVKMRVRYLQNLIHNESEVKQSLLTKIYKNNYSDAKSTDSFEQTYTYGTPRFIKWDNSQDKYTYIRNNSVIYGINEFEQKDVCDYLHGICFESADIPTESYFPHNMYETNYPLVKAENTTAAMIFRGGTDKGSTHLLEIYKGNNGICINYEADKRFFGEDFHVEPLYRDNFSLPISLEGSISSEELQNIIFQLQKKYGDNKFITAVSNELSIFNKKIDIQKGKVQEEVDPLSPKLLIDKSMEEIDTLVSENKEDYFKLITQQFEVAIGNEKTLETKQVKMKK